MSKGWRNDSRKHSLASRGIKSKAQPMKARAPVSESQASKFREEFKTVESFKEEKILSEMKAMNRLQEVDDKIKSIIQLVEKIKQDESIDIEKKRKELGLDSTVTQEEAKKKSMELFDEVSSAFKTGNKEVALKAEEEYAKVQTDQNKREEAFQKTKEEIEKKVKNEVNDARREIWHTLYNYTSKSAKDTNEFDKLAKRIVMAETTPLVEKYERFATGPDRNSFLNFGKQYNEQMRIGGPDHSESAKLIKFKKRWLFKFEVNFNLINGVEGL